MSLTEEERRVLFDECRKLPEGEKSGRRLCHQPFGNGARLSNEGRGRGFCDGFYGRTEGGELKTHKALAETGGLVSQHEGRQHADGQLSLA